MPITKVSFGSTKIQRLRRVALDSNLLKTLELKEGDLLEVSLETATGEIRLRKAIASENVTEGREEFNV